MSRACFLVILFLSVFCGCFSSRILCIYPVPSISHQVVFRALHEELLKRGHELVIMTTNPTEMIRSNMTQIDVHNVSYTMWNTYLNFANIRAAEGSNTVFIQTFYDVMTLIVDKQLQHPQMRDLIHNKNERFDLVIVEGLIPTMFAFGEIFNAPTISFLSFAATLNTYDAIGNPSHPLLYPDMFCPYVGDFSFAQRLHLLYQDLHFRWTYYIHFLPMFEALARKHFGNNVKDVGFLEKQVDLMFINAHQVVMGVRPIVPSLVYLGSLHISPPKPLPDGLKKYLDNSPQGVIYFSLGTNVKSKDLPFERKQTLLQAFSEMPYNVVWKFEDDSLPKIPKNVFISKWLPQQDLLGHPNIKVFLTQGGQQSMDEGLHNGVPMIGMPFCGDQKLNVAKLAHLKCGIHVDFIEFSKESLKATIFEAVKNPVYHDNARRISKLMKDEPMTAAERAVWWTEYVIRHKGAKHLRSPLVDFPFYKYIFLDIIVFISITTLISILVVYAVVKKVLLLTKKYKHGLSVVSESKLKKRQ